tara:strand:+ start:1460 stop:2647 length:1188 start_codon:yes stop_codon:yes gene_type:complete
MENNFTFKDNTFLIDGEILHQCILNNNDYMSVNDEEKRERMTRFDVLLAKSKGRFYNIENIEKITNKQREGVDVPELLNNFWADRALKITTETDGNWESLDSSAYTLIEDNKEKWYALFYLDNKNGANDSAINAAKYRNNQFVGFNEILSSRGKFTSFLLKINGKPVQKNIQSNQFFSPYDHASKFYVIYDPFLFQNNDHILGLKIKGDNNFIISKKTKLKSSLYNNRNHLSLYFDWIYRCFQKSNLTELPQVFLGGRSGNSFSNASKDRLIEIESIFSQHIIESKNQNSSFKIMKKFFLENKVNFFWIDNKMYKKNPTLHGNWIFNDYGGVSWGERKMAFDDKHYKKNLFVHDLKLDISQLSNNIFNTIGDDSKEAKLYFNARNIFENIINEKN